MGKKNILKLISMNLLVMSVILTGNIPVVYSAPPDAETCAFLKRFHGHECPGSLMGLRLGLAAKEVLNAQGPLKAETFLHACPVDGIQVATGTTLGNKSFTLEDRGEMYLILTDVQNGGQVEARLSQEAMNKGKKFRELSEKIRTLSAGSVEKTSTQKEVDAVLDWFRTAPDADVVVVQFIK